MTILNPLDQLKNLFAHVSKRRRVQLWAVLFLTLLSTVAELVSIGAVLPFLAALTGPESLLGNSVARRIFAMVGVEKTTQVIPTLTAFFAIAVIFAGTTRYLLMWAQTRVTYSIGGDICEEIYRRTLYQPYQVHLSRNSSEVIAAITTKVRDVVNQAIGPAINLVSSAFLLIAISAFLFVIDPLVAIVAFVLFGGIYFVIAVSVKQRLVVHGNVMAAKQNEVVRALQEGLMGIRDVLLTGAQEVYLSAFHNADKPMRKATSNIVIISQAPRYAIEATGMVLVAVIAYILVGVLGKSATAMPILGAFALGAQRMLPLLQQTYWSYAQLHGGRASLNDVLQLLNQPMPSEVKPSKLISFRGEIELRNVDFAYDADRPAVLKGVNLRIPKGACVGVIGETGSGKSTLIDIIMGLIPPTAGNLLVDGVVIGRQELPSWQKHISHVPQAIYLSDASIAQNIAFGVLADEIDLIRVARAARQAHIADVIDSWEDGYATVVGERGVRLSGGQRQRIGIARALFRNSDVIIFDEATSALDQETEALVMKDIKSLPYAPTIVMIAHRLSTLKDCDLIIELRNGEISKIGSYESVLLNNKHE